MKRFFMLLLVIAIPFLVVSAVGVLISKRYWQVREEAYYDAVADVRAYHQCFIYPETEVNVRGMVHLEGGNWPSPDYMREAAHFVREDKRDCDLVVTINGYEAGRKP